jgi:hypothetical protein
MNKSKVIVNSFAFALVATPVILLFYYSFIFYERYKVKKLYNNLKLEQNFKYVHYNVSDTIFDLKTNRNFVESTLVIRYEGNPILVRFKNNKYIAYDFDTNCWGVAIDTFSSSEVSDTPIDTSKLKKEEYFITSKNGAKHSIISKYGLQCDQ